MKKPLLLSCLILFFLFVRASVSAQVAAIPFTASLDTFNAISGTVLDAPMVDDVSYRGIPIGFTFNYGGVNHNFMSVNTNGYIQLDSNGTGSFANILSGSQNNVVAAFGADLANRLSNASLQYTTIGTAPNRITIIQWLHYSYFINQGDINFQIWLHEGSNCIRFIYGNNVLVSNPLTTQIGLRGMNNQDFLVLGDTSCNWASAYPFPLITTSFPVSATCNMPSGFAFHWGSCGSNNVRFSYLTGTIFNDINGNGTKDTNETGVANRVLNLTPGNYYTSTDAAGNYVFFYSDSSLTYNITTSAPTYWIFTTPSAISVSPSSQSASGLNFGLQQIPNIHEVAVHCPNWGAKPGQLEPMPISYQNNGTATESDTITFVMDSLYSFSNSNPVPTVQSGQTLKWAYSNLAPGQHRSIMLNLMPSLSAVLGDSLRSTLSIGPLHDTVPSNNFQNVNQLITLAWDPNEKHSEGPEVIDQGNEMVYTIHFQNTGNATADNVTVIDTLDADLDLLSFNLLGSSHNVNVTTEGNGIVKFTFYNIQLPDSGSDMAGSNGFVTFSIHAQSSLAPGTQITNTAGIVFDFNPAVITNTTLNSIRIPTFITSQMIARTISVYPNPATDQVTFSFSKNPAELAQLVIADLQGKIVLSKNNVNATESVSISTLPAGVYVCMLTSEHASYVARLVKGK